MDIWVPKKIIENQDGLVAHTSIKGEMRCKVFKPGFKEPKTDTGWFPNLILNGGLDALADSMSTVLAVPAARVFVGESNTAPDPTQTSLVSPVASSTSQVGSATYQVVGTFEVDARRELTRTIQFSQGAAAGVLREIGFTSNGDTSGTDLFSRALIVDGSGNPTDITVLSDEILQVSYRVSIYFPTTDITGSVDINGSPVDYTCRVPLISGTAASSPFNVVSPQVGAGGVLYTGGVFGGIGVNPTFTGQASTASAQLAGYTPGDHYRDYSLSASLSQGNVPGGSFDKILSQDSGTSPRYKFLLDTPVAKDATQLMTINFRISWGRK